MERQFSFLVVDDEESFRDLCRQFIQSLGHRATSARDGAEALSLLRREWFDIALIDLRLPKIDGLQLVKMIKSEKPSPEVIILTGYGSINTAVEAMKLGAYHYVTKPFQMHEMEMVINRLLAAKRLEFENRMLREKLDQTYRVERVGRIIGASPEMRRIFGIINAVSKNKSTVFIQGESGTGKELVARAIHYQGGDTDRPFIPVNCSSMSATLLESQLFGHVKGAFTGATHDTQGFFRAAQGGTLFLDEIAEISPDLQAKLLRALQEREITPVGATHPVKIEVRVIAATNCDVAEALRRGDLRGDLFYRLNVVSIEIAPLRQRAQDIPLLVSHFMSKFANEYNVAPKQVSPEAMETLMRYAWPGNVRELENVIERAFALGESDQIRVSDLPASVSGGKPEIEWKLAGMPVPSLEEAERALISMAMDAAKGKKAVAARYLQIDRQRLYRKIKKYNIAGDKKPSNKV